MLRGQDRALQNQGYSTHELLDHLRATQSLIYHGMLRHQVREDIINLMTSEVNRSEHLCVESDLHPIKEFSSVLLQGQAKSME